jgi:large subunit ribosomal protein L15
MRRSPKWGFNNKDFRTEYQVVNLKDLAQLSGEITPASLKKAGLIHAGLVKVLGTGTISKALNVKAHKFSVKAKEAIEKAGGKVEVVPVKTAKP